MLRTTQVWPCPSEIETLTRDSLAVVSGEWGCENLTLTRHYIWNKHKKKLQKNYFFDTWIKLEAAVLAGSIKLGTVEVGAVDWARMVKKKGSTVGSEAPSEASTTATTSGTDAGA